MLKLYVVLSNLRARLRSDDRGVTSLEYALLAALIGVVIIGAVTMLGRSLGGLFTGLAGFFRGGPPPPIHPPPPPPGPPSPPPPPPPHP